MLFAFLYLELRICASSMWPDFGIQRISILLKRCGANDPMRNHLQFCVVVCICDFPVNRMFVVFRHATFANIQKVNVLFVNRICDYVNCMFVVFRCSTCEYAEGKCFICELYLRIGFEIFQWVVCLLCLDMVNLEISANSRRVILMILIASRNHETCFEGLCGHVSTNHPGDVSNRLPSCSC